MVLSLIQRGIGLGNQDIGIIAMPGAFSDADRSRDRAHLTSSDATSSLTRLANTSAADASVLDNTITNPAACVEMKLACQDDFFPISLVMPAYYLIFPI
jgi:hypothetical protein